MALKKSANESLRHVFIQWMYTQTHTLATHAEPEFAITLWKEKNSSKGLNFSTKSEEKPQKALIVASFEEDDSTYSKLASNTLLHLMAAFA